MTTPTSRPLLGAVVAGLSFLVLSVLVGTGVTAHLDERATAWFRPNDEWDTLQERLMPIIDMLDSERMFGLVAVVGIGLSLWRASWRPGVYLALVAGTAVVVTVLVKFAVGRSDPKGEMTALGGSYPSGHMVGVLVCLGCCLLVLPHRTRWWQWALLVAVGAYMGAALLFTAAHSTTDVAGGALLSATVLGVASVLPLRATVLGPGRGRSDGRQTALRTATERSRRAAGPIRNNTTMGDGVMTDNEKTSRSTGAVR